MAKSNYISTSRDYGITSESRCQLISVDTSICLHLSERQICIFWVLTMVVCMLRVSTAKKHGEINFWSLKLHVPVVIGRWQDCTNHLTNRFPVAVRLFNNWSQMTSQVAQVSTGWVDNKRVHFTLLFQTLWYELGRQHVKALQAAAISPYLTSPTPPIPLQRAATTPGTSCPTLFE